MKRRFKKKLCPRNLFYFSVQVFLISNSVRVLKPTFEKELKKRRKNEEKMNSFEANQSFTQLLPNFSGRGRTLMPNTNIEIINVFHNVIQIAVTTK